jgi:O-antigen/teichoic acid export membrane protein
MAAGEQYARLAINFASIAVVSRLLTPAEIGVSVIGTGIIAIALALREFATSDCLIQRQEVTLDDIRASFTVLLLLTVLITAATVVIAPWFGALYGEDQLARFLRVGAAAGLIEALSLPIRGLLRRDMAFGVLAAVNTTAAAATAVATIALALAGFSYMSVAWATVTGAVTTTVLSFYFRPDLQAWRPALKSWRSVLAFGGYNGASHVVANLYETVPQLVLGALLPSSAVGLFNRATMLSKIPQLVFLRSVGTIAFPALATEVRNGRSLKGPYLAALGHITVFYWPTLVVIAILAHPIVWLVLGGQWLGVVPLLQILAFAYLAWFHDPLTTPVLLAVGANQDRALVLVFTYAVSAAVLCGTAYFGIVAVAASTLVTIPYMMFVAMYFVRRHVAVRWSEIVAALTKSAAVAAGTAAGPVGVVAWSGWSFDLSITAAIAALPLAAGGWLLSVLVTRHPVLGEVRLAAETIIETSFVQRARQRLLAYGPGADEAG